MVVAGRQDDRVRRSVRRSGAHSHEVEVPLAGRVRDPFAPVLAHAVVADDPAQRVARGVAHSHLRQAHRLERNRRPRALGDPDALAQELERTRRHRLRALARAPPPPVHLRRLDPLSH